MPTALQCPFSGQSDQQTTRSADTAGVARSSLRLVEEADGQMEGQELPQLHHALDVLGLEEGALLEGQDARETVVLRQTAKWSKEYLTRPHPDLGRPGTVCPWVEKSIQRRLFRLTLSHEPHLHQEEVERTFHALRRHFLETPPLAFAESQYKTIVTVFTGLPQDMAASFIDNLHQRLKPSFVSQGLMLGEFYASCPKTGLRNPNWHPLRSSIPLLVIRSMVRPDIAFLHDDKEFALAYLRRFKDEGRNEVRTLMERRRDTLPPESVAILQEATREYQESLNA